ncbi:hypothetical protein [Dactylosporangium sp. CS-033363]|uniref:hypothetical protein n=1 Tax=Dactylosporangium sp. CS-033363 TaxID=3239935 RepID=UPI003D8F0D14
MLRDWRVGVVLGVAVVLGTAACTSSPPNSSAGAQPSAPAESGAAYLGPAAAGAAPSRTARPSPAAAATTATAKTTKPPATVATTPGARVTSLRMQPEYPGWAGLCQPITVTLFVPITFSDGDALFRTSVQLHSTDGNDPAPRALGAPGHDGSTTARLTYDLKLDPANPKRTIEFWAETLEPNRMTSNRARFDVKCMPS